MSAFLIRFCLVGFALASGMVQAQSLNCFTLSEGNLDPDFFPDRQVYLSCPDGFVAVSGGAECYDYANWYGGLTKSFPYENGWAATCQRYDYNGETNNEGAQIVKSMYVRCCEAELSEIQCDLNNDGFIDRGDLREFIKACR